MTVETSPQAAALLMREVICEQIFRQRLLIIHDPQGIAAHPVKSFGIRHITPSEIVPYARKVYLKLDRDNLKELASEILDLIQQDRLMEAHWCACAGEQTRDDCVCCGKPIKEMY